MSFYTERNQIALERERLKLEERRLSIESRLMHKHLGSILTAIVSLAAAVFTLGQLNLANKTRDQQFLQSRLQQEKELEHRKEESLRKWSLDIATYVTANQESIFSEDEEQRLRMRSLLLALFPPDVTETLFRSLEESASPEDRDVWTKGRELASKLRQWKLDSEYTLHNSRCVGKDLRLEYTLNGFAAGTTEHILLPDFVARIGEDLYELQEALGDAFTVEVTIRGYADGLPIAGGFRRYGSNEELAMARAASLLTALRERVQEASAGTPVQFQAEVHSSSLPVGSVTGPQYRRAEVFVTVPGGCIAEEILGNER